MKLFLVPLLIVMVTTLAAYGQKKNNRADVHSFGNSDEVIIKHLALDLSVSFEKKVLSGSAILTLNHKKKTSKLILDTRDLTIDKVTLDEKETPTTFTLGEEVKFLGKPLTIAITPKTKSVKIYYSTSPSASALQWLE
ncbi:MAG: aminopeptidase, partial [Bacteroidota bacterium]